MEDHFQLTLEKASRIVDKALTKAGGVLILQEGTNIGAVGISGGTSDEDESCAIEAIKTAGLEFKA